MKGGGNDSEQFVGDTLQKMFSMLDIDRWLTMDNGIDDKARKQLVGHKA
jgi:hypothetical protein